MMWIWFSLLAWLVLSPVVALFVGRAVTIAEERRTRLLHAARYPDPAGAA
jgi:hypothetical protein